LLSEQITHKRLVDLKLVDVHPRRHVVQYPAAMPGE
jgi:hypothetical protein